MPWKGNKQIPLSKSENPTPVSIQGGTIEGEQAPGRGEQRGPWKKAKERRIDQGEPVYEMPQ